MSGEQPAATGLAGRYATALFELAQEQGKLDAVGSDLAQFEAMLNESEDFARLVRSPIVSRDDQVKAISALADKAGMDDLTKRFAGYIASQRRLFALADIIRAFNGLLAAHRGEVVAGGVVGQEADAEANGRAGSRAQEGDWQRRAGAGDSRFVPHRGADREGRFEDDRRVAAYQAARS